MARSFHVGSSSAASSPAWSRCHPVVIFGMVAALLFCPASAQTQAANDAEGAFAWWMIGATMFMQLVVWAVWLWKASRPNPALHRQFAALEHEHKDLATKTELKDLRTEFVDGFKEIRLADKELGGKVDALRELISFQNGNLHKRLDPVCDLAGTTNQLLLQHLEDHRSDRNRNHKES